MSLVMMSYAWPIAHDIGHHVEVRKWAQAEGDADEKEEEGQCTTHEGDGHLLFTPHFL